MSRTFTLMAIAFGASSLLLMDSAIKGAAILAFAACMAVLLKRDSAATRHLVWFVAIIALLVVPVFSALLPQWRVLPAWAAISQGPPVSEVPASEVELPAPLPKSLPERAEPRESHVPTDSSVLPQAVETFMQPSNDATKKNRPFVPEPNPLNWNWLSVLPILWSLGFAFLIFRLMAARWILWCSERRATVISLSGRRNVATNGLYQESDRTIVSAFEDAYQQLGIRQPVRLLIHSQRTIPVIWGIFRFSMLLPALARQWNHEQLQSVLLHELAHIKRRDTIVQLLAQIACALHWFNPLVWYASWRLHVERERACDDLVLAQGVRASAYAEHLLNVATKLSVARWTSACGLAMASHSPLESRLHAILSDRLNRRKVSTAIGLIGLLLGAGIAIPIAMLRAADDDWNPPSLAHIGSYEFSTFCVHDGKEATFVIAYQGDFDSTSQGSSNAKDRTWTNSVMLTAKQPSIALRFYRTHTAPDKLSITTAPAEGRNLGEPAPPPREFGQKEYDLAKGRVFLLSDNGAVRQLDIATPLVRDNESALKLAALIAAVPPQEPEAVATNFTGKLAAETVAKLKWGEPVNGLRMALAWPPALGDAMLGKKPHFEVVVQNVSEKEIHFLASDEAPNPRKLLIREGERIVQGLSDPTVSAADWKLQPGHCGVVRMYTNEESDKAGTIPSSGIESDLSKLGRFHAIVQMEIATAPTGAWTGKLVTGQTRGSADVFDSPAPMYKDAQALYEVWKRYARTNGDIPGALVGELAAAVKQFIKYNPTWETVPKLNELLPRLDATHDWKPAEAIALLDEAADIQDSLLEPAPWQGTRDTIRQGDTLPEKYADVAWGEEQPSGLRAAWVLEPSAAEYRIGTALQARLLVQNRGQVPVMLQVPTWHQGGVKGTDAKGAEVQVSGISWTTIALLHTVRLEPGTTIEINTPGVGIGPRAGMGPWAGPRVGSNVLAKPGDDLTLTYSPVPLDGSEVGVSEDDPHVSGPSWWLAHIKTRLNRELPLPADAAERTRLLDRAVRELFATAATAEETKAFIADKSPEAIDALAKRLAARTDVASFSGKLPTAPVKFRLLDADANADKQPRVVLGPGEYPLPCTTGDRGNATLKIVSKPVDDRRTNDAQILFEATEFTGILPPDPYELNVPDGWGTWAIVCRPSEGFFYLLHKGAVRKIDYSAPRNVIDIPVNDLPAEFRDEVKHQLDIHEISDSQQDEIFEMPAPPATSLRADEQEEPPTAATVPQPKTSETEPFTAWGQEIGGLQAGVGFKVGVKRAFSHGESASLVVRVRNVGKETVKFEYLRQFFMENPPTVTDANGKSVPQRRSLVEGLRHDPVEVTLDPGQVIELTGSHPFYELTLDLSPAYGTGMVQVQCNQVLGNSSIGQIKVDPVLSTLATGKLELEVKEPAKLPSVQDAPNVAANTAVASENPMPNYVTVVGQLVDDETGQPIEKAGWEWGMADPKKPDQISWGHSRSMGNSHPDGKFEMLVHISSVGNHYPLRVYSAGYETTVVVGELAKPYPEKIERTVRLKRGRSITGVLRDHTGKPVANGWVFFIPMGHQTNIVESFSGTDAHQLPVNARDGAVSEVRTNENGTFALPTGVAGTLAASTDLVDLWPFPLPTDGYAELKMPAPSYLLIDLTYWYLDELGKQGERELSPNSEDPNQCWIQVDQRGSTETLWKNLGYRRQMLVFAKDPRAKLSKGVIVGHVVEGEMDKPISDVGHNKNLSTKIRVALPPGNYRVQRLRAGPFAPVDEQNVELKSGEDTILSWARGDGSSVRGKATWPANMMFVRQPGEAPQKLDWTVPFSATVRIAPVGADGKDGKPIEAAQIQADGSFFVPTNLDPGKYKATAAVTLPMSDESRRFSGYRGPDCIYSQEFTIPEPARGLFGSLPVDVEINMEVAESERFRRAEVPGDPQNAEQVPAENEKQPFTAWGKEVGGLQAGLGFKAVEKRRAYSHGETVTLVLRVRNVGQEDVKFQYLRQFFVEQTPSVFNEKGELNQLEKTDTFGEHIPVEVKLAAGKEIELYDLKLYLGMGSEEVKPEHPYIFGTGKFQIQYEKVFGNSSSGSIKIDPALSKLATGKLELEVHSASPPPAADAPSTVRQHAPEEVAETTPLPEWVLAWDFRSAALNQRYAKMRISSDGQLETILREPPLLRTQLSLDELSELVALVAKNPQAKSQPLSKMAEYSKAISPTPELFDALKKVQVRSEIIAVVHEGKLFELDLNTAEAMAIDVQLKKYVGLAAIGGSTELSRHVELANQELRRKYPDLFTPILPTDFYDGEVDHPSGKISVWFNYSINPESTDGQMVLLRISESGQPSIEQVILPRLVEADELDETKWTLPNAAANIVTVSDDQYVKSGFPVDELAGEGVMWNDVQNGLSLGYRITGDEWRILGKDVKVELWVQNLGDKDVKFQDNMRADPEFGLRVKLKNAKGEDHNSNFWPDDRPPFGFHRLLPPGHVFKVKEFTVLLFLPENDFSHAKGHFFGINPGAYNFHCELELPGFSATGEGGKQLTPAAGEWTGTLTTSRVNVEVLAPDAPAPKPRTESPTESEEVGISKEGEISLERK